MATSHSTAPPTPRSISPDLVPRTIYFPPRVLERIERGKPPGELIAVLTMLLSDYVRGLKGGGGR